MNVKQTESKEEVGLSLWILSSCMFALLKGSGGSELSLLVSDLPGSNEACQFRITLRAEEVPSACVQH